MERTTFATEDRLVLEGDLWLPDPVAAGSAVVCHAHPRLGGSKDYPLLWAIRIELTKREFSVLAFNFRGVMGSEGTYGGGTDEVLDVRAAVRRALQTSDGPLLVCGWSFGAHVALRACLDDDQVDGLVLVGMPLAGNDPALPPLPDVDRLRSFDRPVLLLAGSADQYCPEPELRALGASFPDAMVEVVSGADHYFARREREAGALVGAFAVGLLSRGGRPQ
jgi:alpha/beta superfamily hydrolase